MPAESTTLYTRVGGRGPLVALVDAFYRRVEGDGRLRSLYPDELEGPRARLSAFLVQYFGGPREYEALRGEPRLRLRHLEFQIDAAARDAWLSCMDGAISEVGFAEADAAALRDYFTRTARFLVNEGGLALG